MGEAVSGSAPELQFFFFNIYFSIRQEKPSVCILSELIPSTERDVTNRMVRDRKLTGWVSSQTEMEQCKVFQDPQHPDLGSLANPSDRPLLSIWVRKGTASVVACL